MLKSGILNPQILALLARIRHTNTLVIADRGFPFWPQIETVDISLVDGIPRVLDVLNAIRANYAIGHAWMAEEFHGANSATTRSGICHSIRWRAAHLRAAHRIQETRSARHWPHPHRRHHSVREHDHRVGLSDASFSDFLGIRTNGLRVHWSRDELPLLQDCFRRDSIRSRLPGRTRVRVCRHQSQGSRTCSDRSARAYCFAYRVHSSAECTARSSHECGGGDCPQQRPRERLPRGGEYR